jgi:hypothetical protein
MNKREKSLVFLIQNVLSVKKNNLLINMKYLLQIARREKKNPIPKTRKILNMTG